MTDSKTPEWVKEEAERTIEGTMAQSSPLFIQRVSQALLSAYERGSNDKHAQIEALLKDPVAVRANYMRGGIACQPLIDEAFERGRKEGIEEAAKVGFQVSQHVHAKADDVSKAIRQLLEVKG